MKTTIIKFTGLLLFISLITLLACKKDDDDKLTAESGTIVAKVNGQNFKSLSAKSTVHYGHSLNSLYFYGYDEQERRIGIEIKNFEGKTGTWKISEGQSDISAFYDEKDGTDIINWDTPYTGAGETGEITITEFSSPGVLKGTFRFKAKRTDGPPDIKDVTAGSFNLTVDEGF